MTVCLIGPEVPESQHRTTVQLPLAAPDGSPSEGEGVKVKLYFHRGNFEGYQAFNFSKRVDAVFGFNLGLSVPDYSWGAALAALQDCANTKAKSGGPPLPIVCTSSSRAESVQELLLLEQHGVLAIDKKQTRAIEEEEDSLVAARKGEVVEWPEEGDQGEGEGDEGEDVDEDEDDDEDDEQSQEDYANYAQSIFLQPHAWGWERIQQSGAMANDVYRKSCWLFGGLVEDGFDGEEGESSGEEGLTKDEIYFNRRQARQQRKNKRLKKRARSGR